MAAGEAQFIDVGTAGTARRIAAIAEAGSGVEDAGGPGLMWLSGFKSDMTSTKVSALSQWAGARGLPFTRFDYSGHGQSGGRFEDGTIGAWLEETEAVFAKLTHGPQILIGSSMGGWIALALLRRLIETEPKEAARIKGLALIAPAWDMTEDLIWQKVTPAIRRELTDAGRFLRPSAYDDGPYPITMQLIEEGRAHLLRPRPFDPGRPVRIIHGRLDPDVPFAHSLALQRLLPGGWISIDAVDDGEHRLSRPQDLDRLFAMIGRLL